MNTAIFPLFRAVRSQILAADPLNQPPIIHDLDHWRNGLRKNPTASVAFEECLEFLLQSNAVTTNKFSISRQLILDAIKDDIRPAARFMMQMLWGYKPSTGYAVHRIGTKFQSPVLEDDERYTNIVFQIAQGQLMEAYSSLCDIPKLNTSFATKVLYFESRRHLKIYPLILDEFVARSLARFTAPWVADCLNLSVPRLPKDPSTRTLQTTWRKYWTYVEGCHEIADYLSEEETTVSADQIEYFLFTR